MQTYQYQEQNSTKSIIFIVIYFTVWIIGASFYFGGLLQLADAVDNVGSAKLAGFLVGILVILPFFAMMRLVYTKVNVEIEQNTIRFIKKGKETTTILYSEIGKMIVNAERMNTLHLYDKNGGLLWTILPMVNAKDLITEIPQIIAGSENFKIDTTSKKFFGTAYNTISYQRMG